MIEIYTDGACSRNPGKGGYGVVVSKNKVIIYAYGEFCEDITTNNREELKAMLAGLRLATDKYKNEMCTIYSDSAYCVNIFNEWIKGWARNNWMNSKKKLIENDDLVKELYPFTEIDFPNFKVCKVPGHAGILENEIADAIASQNTKKLAKLVEENDKDILRKEKFDFFNKL